MFRFPAIFFRRPIVSLVLVVLLGVSTVVALYAVSYRAELRQLREAKREVASLISIGKSIDEAQAILVQRGFQLVYDEPIDPTGLGDYLSQLVLVGEVKHGGLSSFLYAVDADIPLWLSNPLGWESPYVFIEAHPNGEIYKVE